MALLSLRRLAGLVSIILGGGALAACGAAGNEQSSGGGGSSGNAAGSGAAGAGEDGDGFIGGPGGAKGCEPACAPPQVCSVEGQCIDEGTCLGDGDCKPGTVCEPDAGGAGTCVPGGECGGKEAKAVPVSPNLLIVLDRSCSMTDKVGGETKWELAVAAINTMTADFHGKIRFGLTLFPDLEGGQCQQGTIPIPVAPGNETAIQTLLTDALDWGEKYFPDGPCVTNIDTAMQQATTEPAFDDVDRGSYALLITDGKQSGGCSAAGGDNGTEKILAELLAVHGVSTFVLGFGGEVDPAQMNEFAEAGGVPASGPTKYYDAQDGASLAAALAAIADKTLGCTFALDEAPPDTGEIYVFFDDTTSVSQDTTHTSGWDYDPGAQQVTFYGAECELLKSGEVNDVDIVFGCGEPVAD